MCVMIWRYTNKIELNIVIKAKLLKSTTSLPDKHNCEFQWQSDYRQMDGQTYWSLNPAASNAKDMMKEISANTSWPNTLFMLYIH